MDLGRMLARPLVVEAHRRVGKNCRDRRRQLRRSAQKVRQTVPREPCRSLTLKSAFRRIAFVPLYRRKALLAGPVHDNKKHANTHRPHEPKDDLRTLEPGAWQAEDRRRLERHHHHRLVSATHICDSVKRRLKADGTSGLQGEFGIGLLSFWTVGDELSITSTGDDRRAYQMVM